MTKASTYFPESYESSRLRFREQTLKHQSRIAASGHWKVPSLKDPDLSVDYAYFKASAAKARTLFVMSSGIHGVEAYAGSAAQELWWQEILPQFKAEQDGLLIVHAMNPYGFKYHYRETENQVNLNRNCSLLPDFFKTQNHESLKMTERYLAQTPVTSLEISKLEKLSSEELDAFVKAVGPGQFQSASGLEFGGTKLEPQIAAFANYVKGILPAYQNLVLLDLHTGLGHRGRLHLLPGDTPESHDQSLFDEIFQPEHESEIYEFTSADTEGFYPTYGSFNNLMGELIRPPQRTVALTLEFGTLGHDPEAQMESLKRLILEHQGRHYGYQNQELENQVRDLFLRKSYPLENDWQESVLQASRSLFLKLFGSREVHL